MHYEKGTAMIRPLKLGLLAFCGILLAASQSPQTTDMAGDRANVKNDEEMAALWPRETI